MARTRGTKQILVTAGGTQRHVEGADYGGLARQAADRQATSEAKRKANQSEDTAKILAELDDLLDEIDEVLEINAEQFVKDYVQKGGE